MKKPYLINAQFAVYVPGFENELNYQITENILVYAENSSCVPAVVNCHYSEKYNQPDGTHIMGAITITNLTIGDM